MKRISTLLLLLAASAVARAQLYVPGGVSTGINNNAPSPYLEYNAPGIWAGTIRANGSSYTSFALYESNALRWALYNHPGISNTLLLANATGQDKVSFTQSGNVGIDNISPETKLDMGNTQASGLQFRYNQSTSYRIRLSPYWNSSTDTRLDFNIERIANTGFTTVMSVGYGNNVGVGTITPAFKLDVEGNGARIKNSQAAPGSYTTFRIQGPDYVQGLEIDFFGNNSITSDLNWSYGGGPGSASIVNVNAKPLTFGTSNLGRMLIDANGNVAIGTFDAKGYKLAVAGKAIAEEVVVKLQGSWPDYVFEKEYELPSLSDLEQYIKRNRHLPEVPTAAEIKENGLSVGEMNAVLLKKVEELTLYILNQEKRITELEKNRK
jgi:hypothetical protein